MKKIFNWLVLGLIVTGSVSCKKYLDINENPNAATNGPADLVLPQAIVSTAAMSSQFNTAFGDVGGFRANIYGVGGYGTVVTYAYTSTDFGGLWAKGYDVAQDFQYVINSTSGDASQVYSTSMARIMKAFVFSKMVDQYNDLPYFEALKGQQVLLPKYDSAVLIYEDLVKELNESISAIATAQAANAATAGSVPFPNYQADPLFKPANTLVSQTAAMANWMRFANTVKLRLLVKLAFSGKSTTFANAQLAAFDNTLGIITDDATVNPVYTADAGRQNPTYAAYGYSAAGVRANAQRIPTRWILSFYNGLKITDPGRSALIFRDPTAARSNQLGNEVTVTTQVPSTSPISASSWFTGTTVGGNAKGFVKGHTQDQVLVLLAEAKFLQAEAYERGYLTGSSATAFADGIKASIRYLNKDATANATGDAAPTTAAVDALYNAYIGNTNNAGNRFVLYALNTTQAQRLEAIGTQKYIALAYITSDEAFNEFRRTTYPTIVNGSSNEIQTFASTQSASTRPDRLPSRIPYPQSEFATNAGNVPNANIFTSLIFWDLN